MTLPTLARLHEVMEATWPAAAIHKTGPWLLRDGQGGGKRVSAASATGPVDEAAIAAAEAGMRALGQAPLFQIRAGDAALDALLAQRGYRVVDPVVFYAAPLAEMLGELPPVSAFTVWEPLRIIEDIWAETGIGPERRAVMHRVQGPRTALLGRTDDQPAGAAFMAVHDRIAMLHALEVLPALRRQGTARNMMRAAALWAQEAGADTLALAVTAENATARALYESLGMVPVGQYHYRMK